MKASAPSLYIW